MLRGRLNFRFHFTKQVTDAVIKGGGDNNASPEDSHQQQYDVIVAAFVALRKLRRTRDLETMVANLGTYTRGFDFFNGGGASIVIDTAAESNAY